MVPWYRLSGRAVKSGRLRLANPAAAQPTRRPCAQVHASQPFTLRWTSEQAPAPPLVNEKWLRTQNGNATTRCREAPAGIEPANNGFADRCLTTWLRRQNFRNLGSSLATLKRRSQTRAQLTRGLHSPLRPKRQACIAPPVLSRSPRSSRPEPSSHRNLDAPPFRQTAPLANARIRARRSSLNSSRRPAPSRRAES